MGARWEVGFSLLKDLLAPDRSWSSQRQGAISQLQSCSFGAIERRPGLAGPVWTHPL